MSKILDVVLYERIWSTTDWKYDRYHDFDTALAKMLTEMKDELSGFGIELRVINDGLKTEIKGYGDLLNSMRISFSSAGVASYCLGHIICQSKNLDILEDLRRGINRVAFAPETVEPAGSDKVICHNCGCGC
ncbi:hypothetical protein [Malonomonas rubra]|uniref:hypothetical protein n=1 Tax=Malonomonas rubra TaxID=57040 RepID=UPI0026EACBC6|nr:hypothetical protein [Malonomonas rubra]